MRFSLFLAVAIGGCIDGAAAREPTGEGSLEGSLDFPVRRAYAHRSDASIEVVLSESRNDTCDSFPGREKFRSVQLTFPTGNLVDGGSMFYLEHQQATDLSVLIGGTVTYIFWDTAGTMSAETTDGGVRGELDLAIGRNDFGLITDKGDLRGTFDAPWCP